MFNYLYAAADADARRRDLMREAADRRRARSIPHANWFRWMIDGGRLADHQRTDLHDVYPAEGAREAWLTSR